MSLSLVNIASAYDVVLRLTILQIYLYQYWTVAETQKKGRSAPLQCTVYMCRPNYYYHILFTILQFMYKCIKYKPEN